MVGNKAMTNNLKLIDDGTMDTVLFHIPTKTTHRFSGEYVAQFSEFEDFLDSAEEEILEYLFECKDWTLQLESISKIS